MPVATRPAAAAVCAQAFTSAYGRQPCLFRAPGRINLIGEHTDYNDGWVMPAAIRLSAWVGAAQRADRRIAIQSAQFPGAAGLDLEHLSEPGSDPQWSASLLGLALLLDAVARERSVGLRGADLYVHSEVPVGAGLSSSAAVEVAVGIALAALNCLELDRTVLAQICQRASHEYAGTRCGIMDPYIACHGRMASLLELDTRSLQGRWHAWPSECSLIVCDTGARHDNSAGAYNLRRRECEEAAERLGLRSLRDLSMDELGRHEADLPPNLFCRSRHVVTENARVGAAAAALDAGNFTELGVILNAAHASLRDDFEVSCAELDCLAALCQKQPGVHGARMMGGGFGGCVLCVAEPGCFPALRGQVGERYRQATGRRATIWLCEPGAGAGAAGNNGRDATAPPL